MENDVSWSSWEGVGDSTVPPGLLGLCRMLPELLFVLYDPVRKRYCYRKLADTEDCGLVAFSQPHFAHACAASLLRGTGYSQVWAVSLDQACNLARERHAVVNSVILCDDPRNRVVHHVR